MSLRPPSLLLGLAVLSILSAAHAQEPPLPAPAVPPSLPASPDTAAVSGPEKADTRLEFPNAQISDILEQYQQLSGKHVIADNKVTGSISLVVNDYVTKSEAIKIIEVSLNLNGYSMVPGPGNIIKVLGLGGQPRSAGVPIFMDIAQVPDSDQIVAFLARLHYLDPLETAGVLQQFVPPGNTVGFNAIPKAGALIITDSGSHIRQLIALIAQIDLPAAPVVEKFIRLERADATKAVEFLNSAFELKATPGAGQPASQAAVNIPNNGLRRPIRRIGEDGQPVNLEMGGGIASFGSSSGGDFAIQGRITLTADIRTNRVHVVTAPVNIPRIEQLLKEYDADTPFAQPVRRPLRFVSAKEMLPILVQALSEPGSDQANGTSPSTSGNNPTTNRNTGSTSGNNPFSNLNGNSSSSNGGFGGSGSSNSGIGESGLDTEPVDTTPTEATVGNTKLIADQRSNTIIILGGAEARDKVAEVLDQLDVRAPQVVIRTVIGELSLAEGKELGFNYLLRSNRGSILSQFNGTQLATTANATANPSATPATGSTASTLDTFTTLASGVASGFTGVGGIISIGRSFDIILSALQSTNRFKTISRPMIFTSNNKKAIIASGQEIAVPTQSLSSSTGTTLGTAGISTNVDYKDVTLQLEVVPLINSDHEVTLDILQKIDNVVAGSGTVVGGNSIPTIATRYLKSTVSAPNNSTIVLGGLITQDVSSISNDVPYLSKIPLIGNLFKTRSNNADRNELIVLMHPEVINTDALVKGLVPNEEGRTYLGHDLETQLLPMEVRKAIPVTQTTTTTVTTRRTRPKYSK